MRRVGTVERTAQGLAIARAADPDELPDQGMAVLDDQLASVGTVVSVFGPVGSPFVAVTPTDGGSSAELLGTKLYAR